MGINGIIMTRPGVVLATAAALGLVGAGPGYAEKADGRSASCPTIDNMPGIGHSPRFTDNNVALYAGGDYTVDGGAAEAEGLLVVNGRATFAKSPAGVFNVGRVGAGSGILPTSGSVMLAVGGDLSIAEGTRLDVGSGLTAGPGYGGSVQVGGSLDAAGELVTNGGASPSRMGAAKAIDPHGGFDGTLRTESASLGALEPTGTAVRTGTSVTFKSTAASIGNIQVFSTSAAELDGTSTFAFEDVPANSSVLINVTGNRAVSISPLSVEFNGNRVDTYSSPEYGPAASRILYNFRESTSLTLSGGGNFIGSILAPHASVDLTASTNGRLYVGGNVKMHGTGNESHNYPWNGRPAFACRPKPGPLPPTTPLPQPGQPGTPARPGTPPQPAHPNPPSSPGLPTPSTQPPGTVPPASGAPGAPGDGSSLAETGGSDTTVLAVAAAAVLVGGAAVLAIARRRRRA
ncbi:choice-of-anchor A family protein [Streptodolium elevatio]|uniref:Choice-of-anchor A family protein n=1 Tax=Streptodolium elevatio TaxID=3157996 RepID=A0ABV3DKD5_9ACTN